MRKKIQYKGYIANIKYDTENNILHGKIENIEDLIVFESTDITKIEDEFHKAVDDYIAFCKEIGKEL